MLVLFTCVSLRQGEDVTAARNLRCLLIDILVNFATTAPELPEPDPLASCNEIIQELLQCQALQHPVNPHQNLQ